MQWVIKKPILINLWLVWRMLTQPLPHAIVGCKGWQILRKKGIKTSGGNCQSFGTPTVSDGISMGTEGMKYSLVSREVIADCIETCANAQWLDGLIVIGGCDKNMPGGMMGILRVNVPAIYVYGGTIKPGKYKNKDLTIVSSFEAVGEYSAGKISSNELKEIEKRACPGTGSCGGMFTANTMSSAFEAMGMSLPFSSTMANEDSEKTESAFESSKVLLNAIEKKNTSPTDYYQKIYRKCRCRYHGHWRVDQRSPPFFSDSKRGRGSMEHR
ncbi:MAG: hypothetical protein CM15mP58_02450 [Burkholderiaceae bacterium]|nr:MAG: hypothetical protein CM15mP58_02450 [Burkholderiaceae bacterium]